MRIVKMCFAGMMAGCIHLFVAFISLAKHIIGHLFALVTGVAFVCTIWAWLIGDDIAPLFLGITVVFLGLTAILNTLSDQAILIAARLSRVFKNR